MLVINYIYLFLYKYSERRVQSKIKTCFFYVVYLLIYIKAKLGLIKESIKYL